MTMTIKAVGDWVLDVLGVPFGGPVQGRDLHGECFTPSTKLHLDKFSPLVLYYHAFDPAGLPQGEPVEIGEIIAHEQRPDGWWFKVLLDRTQAYAQRVWNAAQKNLARASSGSAEHLIRTNADGTIKNWPMVELSLFEIGDGKQPANGYAIAVPALKAHYAKAARLLPIPLRVSSSALAGRPASDDALRPTRVVFPKPIPIQLENKP